MDPFRRPHQLLSASNAEALLTKSHWPASKLTTEFTARPMPGMYSPLTVPRGQFTFDLEGLENPGERFHSRTASVPRRDSGITIGRGFDLGQFRGNEINQILVSAGFPQDFIEQAKGASGLEGAAALAYLKNNPMRDITLEEQWRLFNEVRNRMELDVRRIMAKSDTVEAYGTTHWDGLSRTTQDLIIDLRYRGDYAPSTRTLIQPALALNDVRELARILSDREYWMEARGVPQERFFARKALAESQLRSPLAINGK